MSNASIRIFPDKEMMAADMAEALYAALPESTVIQGCELSAPNGQVIVSPGRMIIKGRLIVVGPENLTIENPSVSAVSTGHVCAICNLTRNDPENDIVPATIEIVLDANEAYNNLISNEESSVNRDANGNIIEDRFNSSNGTAFIELATVTVSPGVGVTSLTPTKYGSHARHSIDYINEKDAALLTHITATDATVSRNKEIADAKATYLAKKSWSNSKFKIYNVTIPHFVVNAGATVKQSAPSTYGVVNTWSNGTIKSQFYDWRAGTKYGPYNTKRTYDYTPSGNPTDYSDNILDEYGLRKRIHSFENYGVVTLRPIGIVAASISNAKVGGKNYASCYFTQWSYSTDACEATVHNSGKDQAIVDVTLRILYAEAE